MTPLPNRDRFAVKITLLVGLVVLALVVSLYASTEDDDIDKLLNTVEHLNLGRNGYILGRALTPDQQQTARRYSVENETPGTAKFTDNGLHVVMDKKSSRVLILYEQLDPVSHDKIKKLVGLLYLDFGDPTIMAHDKTIYWIYGRDGKLSRKQYRQIKKEGNLLKPLATVKLNSSLKITAPDKTETPGSVYYIISSDPVLKLIQSK